MKQLSGSQKRKKRQRQELITQSLQGSLNKYFNKQSSSLVESEQLISIIENENDDELVNPLEVKNDTENSKEEDSDEYEEIYEKGEDTVRVIDNSDINNHHENNRIVNNYKRLENDLSLNIYDPRIWDNLQGELRNLLIENGPKRETNINFPKDEYSRRFSSNYYIQNLPNGETRDREWLVYSKDLDRVFCFCCKLFKTKPSKSQLASEGIRDWKHLSKTLEQHENSIEHLQNLKSLKVLRLGLKKNQTIDKELQMQIRSNTLHWKNVMVRIIAVVKCLAINNLAFRGTNETIDDDAKGIF